MITKRELIRKTIHILCFFTIWFNLVVGNEPTIILCLTAIFIYSISELFRLKKKKIPLITDLIEYCAYPHEKSFVLAPLLFLISILILLTFFSRTAAWVGIVALTLGDGFSTLAGKKFGRKRIPLTKKTLEGSLACFVSVFFGSLLFVSLELALVASTVATLVELFSRRIDNLTVPLATALVLSCLL